MAFDEALAARIRSLTRGDPGMEEKKMFGGLGFLLNGNMCVGVWKDSLIARVGPTQYPSSLAEPGVSEFNITGRSMTGWVLVKPEVIVGEDKLSSWIIRASEFVLTLAPK